MLCGTNNILQNIVSPITFVMDLNNVMLSFHQALGNIFRNRVPKVSNAMNK